MMKIGILTFHRALNYGAFLQAFSLKNFLGCLGNKVEIVDYWPRKHSEAYALFASSFIRQKSFLFAIKYIIHSLLKATRFLKRKEKMKKLWMKYFDLGKKVEFETERSLSAIKYDYLIYGSDQIWWKWNNQPNGLFDWTYWGDYVSPSIKKVSYAPSMGVIRVNETEKKQIAQRLMNFHAISVRENKLLQLIQPLTPKEICQVIDPVFLTAKETWYKYAVEPKLKKKYVLLFNLMNSADAELVAREMSKNLQCELIEITSSIHPLEINKNVYQTLDAFEFLGFIKKAEFVVTSSFHGTAFSIIFEKQFYSVGFGNNSGRVSSLLESLNISERLIDGVNMFSTGLINYSDVAPFLNKQIEFSKKFLRENITNNA